MNGTQEAPARWQAIGFGLIAFVACVAAFIGLSSSGLWIDELFSVYLINHHQGLGEVLRRQLLDVHPPVYPFLMYGWTRIAGFSEWALRLPSAVCAVLAIGVFAAGTRRLLSPAAIAFACAIASLSDFWFVQSQNTRSYGLTMLLAAAMLSTALAFRRRVRNQSGFPTMLWIGLSALALVASFTHAYLLLAQGMILFVLIVSLPSRQIRAALIGTGLLVLALNVQYYRLIVHSRELDLQNLWFSNSWGFFDQQLHQAWSALIAGGASLVVGLLLVFACWRRIVGAPFFALHEQDTRWTTILALTVLVGTTACGIATSLIVAPSFSDRNVLTCAPFAWYLIGRLYDAAGPRGYTRSSSVVALFAILLVGSYLALIPGRKLPRTESWRATSHYVQQLPGCADQLIPVMLPYRFGHASDHFRMLAQHDFFGFYMPPTAKLEAYLPSELAARHPVPGLPQLLASRASQADTSGCSLLTWAVHDVDESSALELALDLARQPGVAPHRVLMQEFNKYARPRQKWKLKWEATPEGYVYVAIPKAPTGTPVEPPALPAVQLASNDAKALGDQVVIDYLTSYAGNAGSPYLIDVYSVQRWTGKTVHEDFIATQRLTCDKPMTRTNWDVWPNPALPGCSPLPLPTSAGKIDGGL